MLTDDAVRAKLERIDAGLAGRFDNLLSTVHPENNDLKALRLLAESQQALREIEQKTRKLITHPPSPGPTLPIMLANALVAVNKIASNAVKGK